MSEIVKKEKKFEKKNIKNIKKILFNIGYLQKQAHFCLSLSSSSAFANLIYALYSVN